MKLQVAVVLVAALVGFASCVVPEFNNGCLFRPVVNSMKTDLPGMKKAAESHPANVQAIVVRLEHASRGLVRFADSKINLNYYELFTSLHSFIRSFLHLISHEVNLIDIMPATFENLIKFRKLAEKSQGGVKGSFLRCFPGGEIAGRILGSKP